MEPSLLSRLLPQLREQFPSRAFHPGTPPETVIVYPAQHPEVGEIEIHDDGGKLTLYLDKFTHSHISNYEEGLSEQEKAQQIERSTVAFLAEIFSDRMVFWGNHKSGGGAYRVGSKPNGPVPPSGPRYVWSGPYGAG